MPVVCRIDLIDLVRANPAAVSRHLRASFASQARIVNIPLAMHHYRDPQPPSTASPPVPHRRPVTKLKFASDLSQCLCDFVFQLLPTQEELAVKEDVRKLLERLIRTIEPHSRLLSFGSTANGFSLRNSGEDQSTSIVNSLSTYLPHRYGPVLSDRLGRTPRSHRSCNYVGRLAGTRQVSPSLPVQATFLTAISHSETKFHVKPLPHARIPIVKLSLDPSPGLPLGIACDIGFENRLALENTRLLMCYAMVDPARVRTMVLFRESPFGRVSSKLAHCRLL
jgi:terminal uridylyltransferase